jgi:hypothetical protein
MTRLIGYGDILEVCLDVRADKLFLVRKSHYTQFYIRDISGKTVDELEAVDFYTGRLRLNDV